MKSLPVWIKIDSSSFLVNCEHKIKYVTISSKNMKYIFVILTIAIGSGKKSVYTVDFIIFFLQNIILIDKVEWFFWLKAKFERVEEVLSETKSFQLKCDADFQNSNILTFN